MFEKVNPAHPDKIADRIAEIEARTEELFFEMEEAETFLKENKIEQ